MNDDNSKLSHMQLAMVMSRYSRCTCLDIAIGVWLWGVVKNSLSQINSDIQSYNTRSKEKYHMPFVTTNIRKFSIKYHEQLGKKLLKHYLLTIY